MSWGNLQQNYLNSPLDYRVYSLIVAHCVAQLSYCVDWPAGWLVGNFGQIYRHDMHRHHSRGRLLGHSINTLAKRNEKEKSNAKSTNGQEATQATQTRTRIQTGRPANTRMTRPPTVSLWLCQPLWPLPLPPVRLPLPRSMSHPAIISLLFWFHTYSTHVSASAQIHIPAYTYTLYMHI